MHGKKSKKRSKRITLGRKYKIKKKVREHERKEKKAQKNNANKTWRSKRDPGVPNQHPFKAEILKEAIAAKQAILIKKEKAKSKISKLGNSNNEEVPTLVEADQPDEPATSEVSETSQIAT